VGSYEIVRLIGEGGMGAVYEARRSDGQFRQRVAVKILKRGMDTGALLLRFRMERQILTGFQHRNIAQLLDGGAAPDGRPFLVMEFIDGEPITEFCDRRKLSIGRRLNLFLQVCSAVHAAHQNLIVHGDIKPGNILVTSEGECKLLDFGIAKILQPEQYPQTVAPTLGDERLLTPDYASPEQLRGGKITTASDIYSLGVLLYELAAGQPPHRFESRRPDQIANEVERQETIRPSAMIFRKDRAATPDDLAAARGTTPKRLQRALARDLDNILLKALRKEPERRYQSVEQFADDIRRYQQGLTVTARKETWSYAARKFIGRNKALSFVGALLVVAIVAGLTAALWQAHRAGVEREKAERRFGEIRRAADSLIFELHAAVARLPGATSARELILRRATEILDRLAKDSGNNVSLDLELADAYLRLGEVQGHPLGNNIGDARAALRSYREAARLGETALALEPENRAALVATATSYQQLSSVVPGREAENTINRAIRLHQQLLAMSPNDRDYRASLGIDFQRRGAYLVNRGVLRSRCRTSAARLNPCGRRRTLASQAGWA
jgi:tetratricopeptide (TPR) repeat protein